MELQILSKRKTSSRSSTDFEDTNAKRVKGHSGSYLGFVPSFESGGKECISYCIEKILDACNAREALIRDAFLEIYPTVLLVYFVDETKRVLETKCFDLTRISYCSGKHKSDSRIFAWIYKQEIDVGFQSECHAIRFECEEKTNFVARKIFEAFHKMHGEIESAISFSQMIYRGKKNLDTNLPKKFVTRRRKSKNSSDSFDATDQSLKTRNRSDMHSQDNYGYATADDVTGSTSGLIENIENFFELEDSVFIG